jgi:hypothetical protein
MAGDDVQNTAVVTTFVMVSEREALARAASYFPAQNS